MKLPGAALILSWSVFKCKTLVHSGRTQEEVCPRMHRRRQPLRPLHGHHQEGRGWGDDHDANLKLMYDVLGFSHNQHATSKVHLECISLLPSRDSFTQIYSCLPLFRSPDWPTTPSLAGWDPSVLARSGLKLLTNAWIRHWVTLPPLLKG